MIWGDCIGEICKKYPPLGEFIPIYREGVGGGNFN
jgi:hypothetical protein